MSFAAVIGLEVHAQLSTRSKLFCGCATDFGAPPNTHTCEVCLGMPGVLPVLNGEAVTLAVRAAVALGCTVHAQSQWARKNYFYPDLPKGYQVSQFEQPLATGGRIPVDEEGMRLSVGLTRIHMEEDAGKTIHDEPAAGHRSLVDFNRGGVPLIEIVGAPELHSGAEAAATLRALRRILRYLGVCDGNLEQGSLRCDANVSIRPTGTTALGTRTEIKNLNSFRFVAAAIDFEIERQIAEVTGGGRVRQETRLYDHAARVTRPMRSKEEAHDYRYFPEPDLPALVLPPGLVERIRASLPELPDAKRERFERELGLSSYDARLLCEEPEVARFFEEALAAHRSPKALANWMLNEVLREAKGQALASLRFGPDALAALVGLVESGALSGTQAKSVFAEMVARGDTPQAIVTARGLSLQSDDALLEPLVDRVIAENAKVVAEVRGGKEKALGFLVGQVMKLSRGAANPQRVGELLRRKLLGGPAATTR